MMTHLRSSALLIAVTDEGCGGLLRLRCDYTKLVVPFTVRR
jgi:hypothetical protein